MPDFENIADHYCGQAQPHDAHVWQTPPVYGSAQFTQMRQCAGLGRIKESITADTDLANAWEEGYLAHKREGWQSSGADNPYYERD